MPSDDSAVFLQKLGSMMPKLKRAFTRLENNGNGVESNGNTNNRGAST
jgi:hypothetical protein